MVAENRLTQFLTRQHYSNSGECFSRMKQRQENAEYPQILHLLGYYDGITSYFIFISDNLKSIVNSLFLKKFNPNSPSIPNPTGNDREITLKLRLVKPIALILSI